jgi:nitronate monooxygenase
MDPDNLPSSDPSKMNFGSGAGGAVKAWRDIWGAGQGIGAAKAIRPAADVIDRLEREYAGALRNRDRLIATLERV